MKQKKWWQASLAGLIALSTVSSPVSAQILVGTYELVRASTGSNIAKTLGAKPRLAEASASVGMVIAGSRDPHARSYVEQWVMTAGPLLVPRAVVEIRASRDGVGPSVSRFVAMDPVIVSDAWASEELRYVDLSPADLLDARATCAELHVAIAEIIQCTICEDSGDMADMDTVGWVLEWTDDDGMPLAQDWWLTEKYEYPSLTASMRTFLRTLDDAALARSPRRGIVKHIAVELVEASPLDLSATDSASDSGAESHQRSEPHDTSELTGGCATGRAPRGGCAALFACLAFGLAVRRRSRARRG